MTADLSAETSLVSVADVEPLVSRSRERALTRQVVVQRLLAVDEAGKLSSVHARIAAESAGVSVRTVWRGLAIARKSGRVEEALRRGGAVTDELWARLSELSGNVAALRPERDGPSTAFSEHAWASSPGIGSWPQGFLTGRHGMIRVRRRQAGR
ncbi:hypothetical protein ACFU7Y_02695 [Kitasatospora sp. NPDC057542]|uniref:hypothetical protein n=1 Tax=Kitasatospora sp. NPDC057542 TaxID=3346162 RepID=UPI0036978E6D